MTSILGRCVANTVIAVMMSGAFAPGFAQESTNQVAVATDWSVFTEPKGADKATECWGVSSPKETVNSRDGKPVQAQRSEILLFVTFRPGNGAKGEVSFTGGYPFAPGSTVNVNIGGTTFELFTEGEWAWPASTTDDASILAAMKKGTDAVLTARSARGTQTKDTFSLRGFTAAMDDAGKRCP
jgi:hypothetical protein